MARGGCCRAHGLWRLSMSWVLQPTDEVFANKKLHSNVLLPSPLYRFASCTFLLPLLALVTVGQDPMRLVGHVWQYNMFFSPQHTFGRHSRNLINSWHAYALPGAQHPEVQWHVLSFGKFFLLCCDLEVLQVFSVLCCYCIM